MKNPDKVFAKVKTPEQIAQEGKRAEMTGEKGLNPYESLFTTKSDNYYLALTDPFFEDAIDALKQLRATENDQGKPREINKINPSELKDISVKPEHILTDRGEIHFRDIKEKNPFILKTAEIKPTPDITHKDTAKLLQN